MCIFTLPILPNSMEKELSSLTENTQITIFQFFRKHKKSSVQSLLLRKLPLDLTLPLNKKSLIFLFVFFFFSQLKLQEKKWEKWTRRREDTMPPREDGLGLGEESATWAGPHLRLTSVLAENAIIVLSFLKCIFAGC